MARGDCVVFHILRGGEGRGGEGRGGEGRGGEGRGGEGRGGEGRGGGGKGRGGEEGGESCHLRMQCTLAIEVCCAQAYISNYEVGYKIFYCKFSPVLFSPFSSLS